MATQKMSDKYPQFMVPSVTQSAADTLTFGRVNVGMSLFDYAGFIISRIEYFPGRTAINLLTNNAVELNIALTGSNSIANLAIEKAQVYDKITLSSAEVGTPADQFIGGLQAQPYVHDYSNFEAGGVLVPAQDLYIACDSTSLGTAVTVSARVYFRVIKLQAADYVELAQRLRVLSSD